MSQIYQVVINQVVINEPHEVDMSSSSPSVPPIPPPSRPPRRLANAAGTSLGLPPALTRRAATFDLALSGLPYLQRRVLRLLLTGASVPLVAQAAGIERYHVIRWLGDGTTYGAAIDALRSDLGPATRERLHAFIVNELAANNDDALDPAAWAVLAVIRAVGRLDSETNLLSRSTLRAERWSTGRP